MSKSELRKCMAAIVGKLSATEKQEQSGIVFEKLAKHGHYANAKRLFIYLSTDNEIDTRPILKHALEVSRKQCFVPFVRKTRSVDGGDNKQTTRMLMVQLGSMRDYDGLPVNHYGIKEHSSVDGLRIADPICATATADLVIVPGVAFASDGRRLGHGKGYYDEFLHNWTATKRANNMSGPYTIGLALKQQLVDDPFAVDGHDFKLDEVICASSSQ